MTRDSVSFLPPILSFLRKQESTILSQHFNPLLYAVEYWGKWVLEEARKELEECYLSNNNEIPVGYIWARTIPCQNPGCGIQIPLMRQYWLAKKDKKEISLYPKVREWGKEVEFEIISKQGNGYREWVEGFNPEEGTISRAKVRCPVCKSMIDDKTTRKLFQSGRAGERMVAVVYMDKNGEGKKYRIVSKEDVELFERAKVKLEEKVKELKDKWLMEPVPDEELVYKAADQLPKYGMPTYGDLFNVRQKLALLVFADGVRRAYERMKSLGYPENFAKAVCLYLGLISSRISDTNSSLCHWDGSWEKVSTTFARQALPMNWDYIETNIFSDKGYSFKNILLNNIIKFLQHLSQIININPQVPGVRVTQSSATKLPYADNYFDAVITDPPYYDNVPYSYLSDFFYVWLKRSIGEIFPEYFATPLTPKSKEIVAYTKSEGGLDAGMKFFEEQLSLAFKEIYRILKPGGIAVIVYAHKSTEGWETVINALLDSGLVVTASWPINTEMQTRLNAKETAALASSIYIVARKMERKETGYYHELKQELKEYMSNKLKDLWEEGVSGGDYFIAAIGAGIEVFGKYKEVMDYTGEVIRADRMLEDIRRISTEYAIEKILDKAFVQDIDNLTMYYVLYRWNYGVNKVRFDDARKLATSIGIDLNKEWSKGGFIRKEKELIYLECPEDRDIEHIESSKELIDVLHHVLILWEKGKEEELVERLYSSGYGLKESFYVVTQAIGETLKIDIKEKKLIDGFLVGKNRIKSKVRDINKPRQGELDL